MAGGRPAGRRAGGGEGIEAPRHGRARLSAAAGALAAGAGIVAYAAWLAGGPAARVLAAVGAGTLVLLALALWRGWTSPVAWSLALLAAGYALALALRPAGSAIDAAAPLVAAALLLVGELAYWALDLRGPGHEERTVVARRLAAVLGLAALSVLLGAAVVAVSGVSLTAGLAWNVIGIAAAAAVLAVVARLARGAARAR